MVPGLTGTLMIKQVGLQFVLMIKRMGYISIAVFKDGLVSGYKWGNYGKDEAESISFREVKYRRHRIFCKIIVTTNG